MTVYYDANNPKRLKQIGACKMCEKPLYENRRKGIVFCSTACKSEWFLNQRNLRFQKLELAEVVLTKEVERLEAIIKLLTQQIVSLGETPCA